MNRHSFNHISDKIKIGMNAYFLTYLEKNFVLREYPWQG